MLRQAMDTIRLSVADPTQSRERIQIRLPGRYSGPGCTYDPAPKTTTVSIELPADAFAGQTVHRSLHAK
jgi:hypothetical protein